jgi:hypothetical protein
MGAGNVSGLPMAWAIIVSAINREIEDVPAKRLQHHALRSGFNIVSMVFSARSRTHEEHKAVIMTHT